MPLDIFLTTGLFQDFLAAPRVKLKWTVQKVTQRKIINNTIEYFIHWNENFKNEWQQKTDIESYGDTQGVAKIDAFEFAYQQQAAQTPTPPPLVLPNPSKDKIRFFRLDSPTIQVWPASTTEDELNDEIQKFNNFLKEEKGKYIYREWWLDRGTPLKKLKPDHTLAKREIQHIKDQKELNFFVLTIEIIDPNPLKTEETFEIDDQIYRKQIDSRLVHNQQPFDITTYNIHYSATFNFPVLFLEKEVGRFIDRYNTAVNKTIRLNSIDTLDQLDKDITSYWKLLFPAIPTGKKTRPLEDWIEKHNMDIRLLTKHAKAYALYLQSDSFWGDDVAIKESLLMPRSMALSYKDVKATYNFNKNCIKKLGDPVTSIFITNEPNPYRLLVLGGGVPQAELTTEASHLGSGVHNWAVLKNDDATIPTAINNAQLLLQYTQLQPKLTEEMGTEIARILGNKIVAKEYPVYRTKFELYSRIDAITNNFTLGEGLAIWEYKTRWGKVNQCKVTAEIEHVKQAAFYCKALKEMTNFPVKYCYILYVIGEEKHFTIVYHRYEIKPLALTLKR
jgi:hypothetical protein